MCPKKLYAYWISPTGRIIPVPNRHIEVICQKPYLFELPFAYVQKMFDQNSEPLGYEGRARQIIMGQLIRLGWIRLRFLRRPFLWRAQAECFSKKTMEHIILWDKSNKISELDPHMEIDILLNQYPHNRQLKICNLQYLPHYW